MLRPVVTPTLLIMQMPVVTPTLVAMQTQAVTPTLLIMQTLVQTRAATRLTPAIMLALTARLRLLSRKPFTLTMTVPRYTSPRTGRLASH